MPFLYSPTTPVPVRPVRDEVPELDLEIIVPAYNEEQRLPSTLRSLAAHLGRLPLRTGLRVLDNGSSDRTAECADQLAAELGAGGPSVAVTGCARRGKGAAITRGMTTSRARWAGFCDADLATPATAVDDALALLEKGRHVVLGSRYCPGGRLLTPQPWVRRLGGAGFRLVTRRLAGEVTDTQCGFKVFDVAATRPLFRTVTTTGFAFDLEVVARARAMGLAMAEFPVSWSDRQGSTFRPLTHASEVAGDLLRLYRELPRPRAGEV